MEAMSELFEEAVQEYRGRLTQALERMRGACSPAQFCEVERLLLDLTLELAADMTQRVVQDISDDRARAKAALARVRKRATPRGIQLRVERRRKTPILTVGGRHIEVVTPYAAAAPRGRGHGKKRGRQGTGVYPVLDELGIVGRSTPAARLRVSHAVCEANSVTAARELLAAGGLDIDHKRALRLTYLVTKDALRARKKAIRRTTRGNHAGAFAGRRVVATIDGGRVQIRRRVAGRPKKGGRKRFETEWREPKVLTIYVLGDNGRRDRAVPPVIDGTLGDADAAFELMTYHLRRLGAHAAVDVTLIGDAAEWIWNRSDALRRALGLERDRFNEIVDYFHVVERLGEMSRTQATWGEEMRLGWLAAQKERLKAGQIEEIEAVVRAIGKRDPEAMETQQAYWSRHRERLRYADFRARGLPVGSGMVESSVRRVVNLRLKGASIAWTEDHAEGILHLRAHAKAGRWEELERAVLAVTGWRPTARQRASPRAA